MKNLHLLAMIAMMFWTSTAVGQQVASPFGLRSPPPRDHGRGHHGGKFHGLHGGVWIVEREVPVIIEREVVREVVQAAPAAPPPEPRKPYVVGKRYASLPSSCMKLIEGGASYYYCGAGEWYRQMGSRGARYLAVAR